MMLRLNIAHIQRRNDLPTTTTRDRHFHCRAVMAKCKVTVYVQPRRAASAIAMRTTSLPPLCFTSIVHFSYIDQLFAPSTGNIFGVFLRKESLIRCFDSVHGVSSTCHPGSEIIDTGAVGHFPDELLAAEAKSYRMLADVFRSLLQLNIPGGRA